VEVLGNIIFLVKILGKIMGVSFVNLYLEGNTKTINYTMYLEKPKYLFKN
jgi:hypothetical protein